MFHSGGFSAAAAALTVEDDVDLVVVVAELLFQADGERRTGCTTLRPPCSKGAGPGVVENSVAYMEKSGRRKK